MYPLSIAKGYIPLQVGQKITMGDEGTEFTVLRKLGWGVSGSVWLVQSEFYGFTAVKILTAVESSACADRYRFELEALNRLHELREAAKAAPSKPLPLGWRYCIPSINVLSVDSSHAGHYAILLPPCSSSLEKFIIDARRESAGFRFELCHIKRILRQVSVALHFFHLTNMVHTDLKSSNIFIPLEGEFQPELLQYLQTHPALMYEPHIDPQISPKPIVTYRSQTLPRIGPASFDKWHVILGDYGEAIPVEQTHRPERQNAMPIGMRAPELTLGVSWGQPIDVWALGVLAFELVTADMGRIFDVDPIPGMCVDEIRLARMEELCGPFPESMVVNAPNRGRFFTHDGRLANPILNHVPRQGNLRERIVRARPDWSEKDVSETERFVRRCLTIDPIARPTVKELVDDQWYSHIAYD
ncbi:kinase-like domain-containing protein [Pterulicium gracile]|uniref:Kinase-like domain-containing protein n=1 Tax=Pterulicium gracile TaxID=1884261 RepID=A0A5C3QD87_9AGAR|nr:kinase-like domain-containing protein [Pterula gracilis]